MEHTIHLASKAFIEEICPTPSRFKKKKVRKAGLMADEDNNEFEDDDEVLDDEEAWLASLVNNAPGIEGEEVDEDIDFDPGDLLGKVLALVNQVRASPQARVFFATMCQEEKLTPLELIKWIRTRWGSMYDLIDHVLLNRAVSNSIITWLLFVLITP
jgi:hypothetical protein